MLVLSLLCGSTADADGVPAGRSGLCGSSSSLRLVHMRRASPQDTALHRTTGSMQGSIEPASEHFKLP
jgi:hypothetical protein